jgi:hypothetical protein
MIESEWLNSDDAASMLSLLYDANFRSKRLDPQIIRKMRLFGCGCCRELWDALPPAGRNSIEVAEGVADGAVQGARLNLARDAAAKALPRNVAKEVVLGQGMLAASILLEEDWDESLEQAHANADVIVKRIAGALAKVATEKGLTSQLGSDGVSPSKRLAQVALEVFGNPFVAWSSDKKWLTPNVLALAESIYAQRAFDRLPALANELEAAGCDDAALLSHCRASGPHFRGCWAVDQILGRCLDGSNIRKRAKKAAPASPALEDGAVWVTVEEPYGLVFVYDEGNRAALEKSALAEHGIELYHEASAEELKKSGLLQMVSFDSKERDAPFVGQLFVGPRPSEERITAKSASKGRCGILHVPTGRLRLEGATSLTIGPGETDNPSVEVNVPSGVYELGLYIRKSDKVALLVLSPTGLK